MTNPQLGESAEQRVKAVYPDAFQSDGSKCVWKQRNANGIYDPLGPDHLGCTWEIAASRLPNPLPASPLKVDEFVAKLEEWHVNNLSPCPFCGSPAAFGEDGEGWTCIECTNMMCRVSTPFQASLKEDCKPLLAERWNRRIA